jgi:hypothetical protein
LERYEEKTTAVKWRVVCTIHLPITLIWLWRDEDGRKRQLLEIFMDLVPAVRLANMRVVSSPGQADEYDEKIFHYIQGIQTLSVHNHNLGEGPTKRPIPSGTMAKSQMGPSCIRALKHAIWPVLCFVRRG